MRVKNNELIVGKIIDETVKNPKDKNTIFQILTTLEYEDSDVIIHDSLFVDITAERVRKIVSDAKQDIVKNAMELKKEIENTRDKKKVYYLKWNFEDYKTDIDTFSLLKYNWKIY